MHVWDNCTLLHTVAYIDMCKSRGPLGHSPKGYGVHREPRLPDCLRHGLLTLYAFSVSTRFSEACPNILGKQISDPGGHSYIIEGMEVRH